MIMIITTAITLIIIIIMAIVTLTLLRSGLARLERHLLLREGGTNLR